MSDATPPASFSRVRQIDRKIRPPVPKEKDAILPPSYTDIIFHTRNVSRSRYYFTSGHQHLGKARNVIEERSPFKLPPDPHLFAYAQCWKAWNRQDAEEKRKANYMTGHSYKTKQSKDLLQRLRLDGSTDSKIIAMTDVDPQYFTELRGRVVGQKFSKRQYVEDTRDVLRTRLLAGQERDECIRIDQQFEEEQRRLDKVKRKYRRYVNGFEEFLSKDHERSMEVLSRAEEEARKTADITSRRNQLLKEYGQVRLEVYYWEEAWRMVMMCQKFLYQVSPLSWRLQHDQIQLSESGLDMVSAKTEDLFDRYRMAEEVASLDSLIEMFQQDVATIGPPEMYFNDPNDLIHVFRAMELQNLNALTHLESLAAPMAEMEATITEAKAQIQQEISEIVEAIDDLEAAIQQKEERAANLEKYANYLLQGVFRELVCSEPVLHLRVFVEDTYENCVAPNDANLDSFSMMKAIEKTHEELNMLLDNLPPEVVEVCEQEGFKQEMKAMKEAENAAKKFELMNRLLTALKRIMEPPKEKTRQRVFRSSPIKKKVKPIPPPPPPTTEELQYLTYFTNYCPQDDHNAFRSRFPDDFDLSFSRKRREVEAGLLPEEPEKEEEDAPIMEDEG
ncbi:cilia- and flagella-associated protein 100-like [Orussus abietinus]|uniref:cilia- and flagella-associated protein 100-like n=1 Tax=Orussus abietinus TaxID=222816 RepID=UPI000C716073|nr:cilia- and flagella-associated protein 100-like [Orussus abietinus]